MKIILIRHAEVDIDKNSFAYAFELTKWLEVYNDAEIKREFISKSEITDILNASDKIVCSTLKRSYDSIALYGERPDEQDEVFNEVALPYANWRWIKLPLSVWAIVFRVMWLFGYAKKGESLSDAQIRAKQGAKKLIAFCDNEKTVTLLGHGLMNRLIAKELRQQGWKAQNKMGSANWSYGVFTL